MAFLAVSMGFFDRFNTKKPPGSTPPPHSPNGHESANAPAAPGPSDIAAQLVAAREKLDASDLPGAIRLYELVLATAGDRPDVLVTISGDLGSTGHLEPIVELIAPRYDAERHGPATGLNLLQAYLALRNSTAAQHLLDILFSLKRPELEQRLFGFSNALAELIEAEKSGLVTDSPAAPGVNGAHPSAPRAISLVSISKPIWFYGLEPLAEQILPPKGDRLRRIAFAQLAVPGYADALEKMKSPEDELGRFSRGLPLWFAESFYFSPHYAPIAAIGLVNEARHYALFPAEWTTENLRQLVETSSGGLDYIFTGAVRQVSGDTELILRVWEVKKFRERKQFTARWSPATADAELAKLIEQIRLFMEWSAYPKGTGLAYAPPASASAWIRSLGASLTLFLGQKNLLSTEQLSTIAPSINAAAENAASSESAALAWLTLRARAEPLGVFPPEGPQPSLPTSPIVEQAQQTLGGT